MNYGGGDRQEERRREEGGWDWGKIALGVGAVAAGAAALYVALSEDEQSASSNGTGTGRSSNSSNYALAQPNAAQVEDIVLAVDATPTQGGGVLVLHNNKKVYSYTLNWTACLQFPKQYQQPDKFEVANAFIALKLFESEIVKARGKATIKVDNTKFRRRRGIPHDADEDDKFWELVKNLAEELNGEWVYTNESQDKDLEAADQLSRVLTHDKADKVLSLYSNYKHFYVGNRAFATLQTNLSRIPLKYHVK